MPLCQLFINKDQQQFMLMKMPKDVSPDNYQSWIVDKEQEKDIQAFEFSQQLLDRIVSSYVDDSQTDDL